MADKRGTDQKQKRSSLLGRLFKLVLFLAILAAAGLVAGFKYGKPVQYKGEEVQVGKWAWQDFSGFKSYTLYWKDWTLGELKKADEQVQATDRIKKGAEYVADKSGELAKKGYDKVKDELTDKDGQAAPAAASPADLDAQRAASFGYTDAEASKLQAEYPGYLEAWKAGNEAMKQGRDAYSRWAKDRQSRFHADAAKERFEAAREHFEEARDIYPDDTRPLTALQQIQEYIQQLDKDRPANY